MREKGEAAKAIKPRPFLKWAGGKGQLLDDLYLSLPDKYKRIKTIDTYVEPFVGGGAFFFFLKGRFKIKNAYLYDVNPELYVGYKVVQNKPEELIHRLKELEEVYWRLPPECKKATYYTIREAYNLQADTFDYHFKTFNDEWIARAAHLIFLNKTCYNGLFRQNSDGKFNVPHGKYNTPQICDADNIRSTSEALKDTEIFCGDFMDAEDHIKKGTLVYLDPPYRPLTQTSSFTQYAKDGFDEKDQIRLAEFYERMAGLGAHLILSNSDPKNENPDDNFFDVHYKDKGFFVKTVRASRLINCNAEKRGRIYELIITSYKNKSFDITDFN